MTQHKLPTLEELQADPGEAFKADQLNWLLNQPPPQNWVMAHPLVKVKKELNQMVPMPYLPIDKVEFLLTKIFKKWNVEVLAVQALFNAIQVTVRIHYLDPTTNEMRFTDGVGASGVQTDKDAKASDLASIKLAAVQMAAPSAKSYAIKDAAENLGKIFGRDLSRKNTIQYEPFEPPQVPQQQQPVMQQPQIEQPTPWQQPQFTPPVYQDQPSAVPQYQQPGPIQQAWDQYQQNTPPPQTIKL